MAKARVITTVEVHSGSNTARVSYAPVFDTNSGRPIDRDTALFERCTGQLKEAGIGWSTICDQSARVFIIRSLKVMHVGWASWSTSRGSAPIRSCVTAYKPF